MSVLKKIKDATIPSLFAAGAGLGIYFALYGNPFDGSLVTEGGTNIPNWIFVGGSTFLGSEIGSLVDEFIIPKIPVVKDLIAEKNVIVPAVSAGAGTYLAMMLIAPNVPALEAFAVGGGGALIGQMLYKNY